MSLCRWGREKKLNSCVKQNKKKHALSKQKQTNRKTVYGDKLWKARNEMNEWMDAIKLI